MKPHGSPGTLVLTKITEISSGVLKMNAEDVRGEPLNVVA